MSDVLAREVGRSDDEAETQVLRPRWLKWSYRIAAAVVGLAAIVFSGALAIYLSGDGRYSFLESAYFAVITVSTVGFSELPGLDKTPFGRVVTVGTILSGIVVLAYFQSTLTAFFVEGAFGSAVRRRRMERIAGKMKDHYILVGCGRVGRYVAHELHRTRHDLIIIERDPAAVHHASHEIRAELPFLEGDAADDEILEQAGIERAKGLVTTLSLDRDNLFVTLSARTMNPNLRIISKVANAQNTAKFVRAGASATISPQQIGGLRLASELLRPGVTAFLDEMIHLPDAVRFHEIEIESGTSLDGTRIVDSGLRDLNLLIVGIRQEDGTYIYNPDPQVKMTSGSHLIMLGPLESVSRLRARN